VISDSNVKIGNLKQRDLRIIEPQGKRKRKEYLWHRHLGFRF
jgi:hypothetical protein